jgi:NAD-dependent dihydropyrimidine dehydrogenase PreA subunit
VIRKAFRLTAVAFSVLAGLLGFLWLFGERWRILRPSTRAYMEGMGGWRSLLSVKFWEGYAYLRWSNQYITWSRRWTFPLVRDAGPDKPYWAEMYHGKVVPTETAKALISVEQDVPRQNLEQIIPYQTARDIVLSGTPDIAVYDCPCRAGVENPCTPTQVCMVVGQPFVDFIMEHNPRSARRITTQEAMDLLQAEHERGHIHAAYFKDIMLDRFYAICNCCACCCGGIQAMKERGVPMVISSGYIAQVSEDDCIACGTCEDACPFDAITMEDIPVIDWEACLGCGVCEGQCTQEAITLVRDERKPAPLEIEPLFAR